eukprot:TRINITY_DN19765_c2_g1_i1.p1 TRINITY_DN19765_c2_g1~~TRINITY_DN19765_c2_g1_i1.p1  ORF type:complete len:301 (+),score=112.55 TRINITY_DN19765_c2_g1_i1:254-1156(+)
MGDDCRSVCTSEATCDADVASVCGSVDRDCVAVPLLVRLRDRADALDRRCNKLLQKRQKAAEQREAARAEAARCKEVLEEKEGDLRAARSVQEISDEQKREAAARRAAAEEALAKAEAEAALRREEHAAADRAAAEAAAAARSAVDAHGSARATFVDASGKEGNAQARLEARTAKHANEAQSAGAARVKADSTALRTAGELLRRFKDASQAVEGALVRLLLAKRHAGEDSSLIPQWRSAYASFNEALGQAKATLGDCDSALRLVSLAEQEQRKKLEEDRGRLQASVERDAALAGTFVPPS